QSNTPGKAGPTAPLNGWTYNDTSEVNQYLGKAPASKIILGVPYYGYKWSTGTGPGSTDAYATATGGGVADTYAGVLDDFNCALQQAHHWDSVAASPWATWWSPSSGDPCGGNYGSNRELYYDDAQSLGYKYDLVNNTNIRGAGMWALGYDGTSKDLWNELGLKFVSHWEPLGGPIGSGPDLSSWGPNRLDAFVRGTDTALWHRSLSASAWSNWESLGGVLSAKPSAVAANGKTDVFIRGGEGNLWHRSLNGTTWGSWETLGGPILDGPGASTWGPSRLDVFARGSDNHLWHRWFDGTTWSPWSNTIGVQGLLSAGPSAVSWGTGRIDVTIRGSDNSLWHLGINIS